MKLKISLTAFAFILFVTSWASAADGVRYKDRLFKVSKAKTVTVAENVPFLDPGDDGANYNTLSEMMYSFNIEPMMYFYKEEITKKQPLLMDIYEPVDDNAEKRAAVIVCHGGAFVASSKDDCLYGFPGRSRLCDCFAGIPSGRDNG